MSQPSTPVTPQYRQHAPQTPQTPHGRREPREQQATRAYERDEPETEQAHEQDGPGIVDSVKNAVRPYVENHEHAVLYGIIGFAAAALILFVGFWPTVLLALFAAVGVVIGKYRDGDSKTHAQVKQALGHLK